MKKQIYNPYLPLNTYIPDGEPHVFGDRLYIFGSHDKEGGDAFCMLPYECWSAPLSDLSDFRCEGIIYEARQDPAFSEKQKYLFAPDVVQGNDGKFYLYYAMSGDGCFTGPIHVAVSDTPKGRYEYYGAVQTTDGNPLDLYITFDPAVMNDNGKIWLYYGWSLEREGAGCRIPNETKIQAEMMLFGKTREEIEKGTHPYMGANAVQLKDDMLTVVSEPSRIIPGQFESEGTGFEGHAFFEASSVRKIGDVYYFIYSSQFQHELCYATSRYPDRDFVYGGTLISNGDIRLNGRRPEDRLAVTGNNHGSLVQLNSEWYIFYHRHTHKTTYSRQGCAEKIRMNTDGSIDQAEMTSCGLNDGPLAAEGIYPAVICCNLTNGRMPHQGTDKIGEPMPHITHMGEERFLSEIGDRTLIGYKYFEFDGRTVLTVKYRGTASGVLKICADEREIGTLTVEPSKIWRESETGICEQGTHALYLFFEGNGMMDIMELGFRSQECGNMIPNIRGIVKTGDRKIILPNPLTVSGTICKDVVKSFAERLAKKNFEFILSEDGFICIIENPKMEKEAYLLSVQDDGIRIESSGKQGAIWALTTLFKMIDENGSVQTCTIEDTPRMAHRGLHLDVARHFFTADEVKRIIEQIALAKMNVFHWHLADDQGWRIESRKYPKLHECSGEYYTQEEIRDVVAFADARGVEVIPEIDMPGHTRGILAAYPEYSCSGRKVRLAKVGGIYRVILCAGSEKTYTFIEDLLDEICPLFSSGRFHIGGDEAPKVEWQSCPVCRAKMDAENISRYEDLQGYFSQRVSKILKRHGKRAILWDDSLESSFRPEDMQMQYWSVTYNKPSAEYIARGGEWIYSDMFEMYLDYPHAMTSVKKIYENQIDLGSCEWNPIHAPYGYEACVWTEHITKNEELEKRIFPRIYVLAELAWYGAGDYAAFEDRLKEEMAQVERAGVSTTPYADWNPQGQERQQEAFGYMAGLNMPLPEEDKDEVVDPSGVGEDFQRKFMSRFFREEDLPVLMNAMK